MARRTGSHSTSVGSRAPPPASGSCRSIPRLPCVRSIRSAYSTMRRTRSANGLGARASTAFSAAGSRMAWRVASSGTRSSRTPASSTRASASGSTWALNSASGVTLPGTSTAPPIATTRPAPRIAAASASTARARLVSGPSATIVRPRSWRRAASTITRGASTEEGRGSTGGQSGRSPSPSTPWYGAILSGRASGRAAPAATSGGGNGRRRAVDRKSVGEGKRGNLGGRRILKKKKKKKEYFDDKKKKKKKKIQQDREESDRNHVNFNNTRHTRG